MSSEPWKEEWNKFSPEAIEEMKRYSDQTHLHREWMSYVYEKDGQYHLGEPSYGDESRIEVNPTEKAKEDAGRGLSEGQRTVKSIQAVNTFHPLIFSKSL